MTQSLYQELDFINESRALILQRGQFDDPIICRLRHFALENPPVYEAISYVWGTRLEPKPITVEGQELQVRQNLEAALRHLRLLDSDRVLWIDAICINQDNNKERGHQVKQMGKIYQHAQSVTVWLGPSKDRSDEAMDVIRRMIKITEASIKEDTISIDQIYALSYLVDRQWFRRRWVAQEIAFAATALVQCGHSVVSWQEFIHTVHILQCRQDYFLSRQYQSREEVLSGVEPWPLSQDGRYGDVRARNAANFLFISQNLLHKDSSNRVLSYQADIETLVSITADLHVSDPRDFVYSLVSLASDTHDSRDFIPDYKKSPLEVCIALTRHVIKSTKSLDVVCRPWAPQISGIPSWLAPRAWPNYTFTRGGHEVRASGGTFVGLGNTSFYSASKTSAACAEIFKPCNSDYVLKAQGFTADTVNQIHDYAGEGYIPKGWRMPFLDPRDSANSCIFSQIMVAGKTVGGDSPPESYSELCKAIWPSASLNSCISIPHLREEVLGWKLSGTIKSNNLEYFSAHPDTLGFLQRVADCVWNRRLVETSEKRLGLVPKATQTGDLIAVLLGCSVPLVLRPRDDHYTLIGEAYIHGLMDGEAMTWREETMAPLQEFVLL